jgi:hypothetical protein
MYFSLFFFRQRAGGGEGARPWWHVWPHGELLFDVASLLDFPLSCHSFIHPFFPQSRLVRNETTYFYWTTRRDEIDCRSLRKDQMTNHYAKSGTFTTKVTVWIQIALNSLKEITGILRLHSSASLSLLFYSIILLFSLLYSILLRDT